MRCDVEQRGFIMSLFAKRLSSRKSKQHDLLSCYFFIFKQTVLGKMGECVFSMKQILLRKIWKLYVVFCLIYLWHLVQPNYRQDTWKLFPTALGIYSLLVNTMRERLYWENKTFSQIGLNSYILHCLGNIVTEVSSNSTQCLLNTS